LDWAKAEQEMIAAKAINKDIFFIATCLFFKGFELIGRKHRKEEIYIQVFISQQSRQRAKLLKVVRTSTKHDTASNGQKNESRAKPG